MVTRAVAVPDSPEAVVTLQTYTPESSGLGLYTVSTPSFCEELYGTGAPILYQMMLCLLSPCAEQVRVNCWPAGPS